MCAEVDAFRSVCTCAAGSSSQIPTNLYPTALICALFYEEETGTDARARRQYARLGITYTRARAYAYMPLGPPNNYSLYIRFMHLRALTDYFNEGNFGRTGGEGGGRERKR